MLPMEMKSAIKAAPHRDVLKNVEEHLLRSIVSRVIFFSDVAVGSTSRIVGLFEGFRNAHELAAKMSLDVIDYPEAPDCFADLLLPLGASIPPQISLTYFAETAQSWKVEALGATDGRAGFRKKEANLLKRICNAEYGYDVVKLLHKELKVNRCVLKCGGGIIELFTEMETVTFLSRSLR